MNKSDENRHGYWEPHSSSVDFCETNYLLTQRIVEPHNAWSSLIGITAFGILGLWMIPRDIIPEPRVRLSFWVLIVTGLGSCGLHATLNKWFQSFDELPMIYMTILNIYSCAEVDAPNGAPNYPELATVLTMGTIACTLFYFSFQHMYWVFLVTFSILVTINIAWSMFLVYRKYHHFQDPKTLFAIGGTSYLLVGTPVWILDMLYCHHYIYFVDNNLPFPIRGMTPHVIWHAAAGLGGYCSIVCLLFLRCQALGIPVSTRYIFGCIPLLEKVQVTKGGSKDL